MDLISFSKVLWRRKWIILLVSIIALTTTYFFVSRSPKQYISTAQLATGFTDKQEDRNENTPNAINDKFSNLIELIKSPNCASMVSYKLILNDLESAHPYRNMQEIKSTYSQEEIDKAKIIFKNKFDSLNFLLPDSPHEETSIQILKSAAYDDKYLLKKIEVKRIPHTDFVEISFTSENPNLSAFIVNSYCQEIIRYYNYVKASKIEKSLQYYGTLVSEKKKDLDKKIDSLDSYKATNDVTNYSLETQSKLDQISSLQLNLDAENQKAQAIRQSLKTINQQLSQQNTSNAEEKSTNNRIYELRKRISDVNSRFVNGGMKNTSLGDSLKMLRAELEIQVAKSGGNSNQLSGDLNQKKLNLEIELSATNANISALTNSIGGLKSQLTGFASKETTIGALELAVSVAKEEYLLVMDKFNALKNLSLNSGNIHQIKLAMPPDFPIPSNALVMTLLAGIVSAIFCIVMIFLVEYVDVSIKTVSNFQKQTNLPLLGFLNELKSTNIDFPAIFSNNNNSPKLETFKELLRKLRFETEAAHAKTLLFTSTRKGEGKSFVVLSLAYSLSLSNKKILIIDANFKDNTLSQMFADKIKEEKVLNSDEMRKREATINFDNYIFPTPFDHIDIIGCKTTALSPSEIFTSHQLKELLSFVSHRYDYIVIEAAELNQYADSKELTSYVDKIIAVFSAKTDLKHADKASIEYLKSLNGKFAGSILNKVNSENLNS